MTEHVEFKPWGKIYRLRRNWVASEKIDGSNACVGITDSGQIFAQSRNRIVTQESDNYGFAAWVRDNATGLSQLGPGYHYGEFYGRGINCGYGLSERRFALFNTARWSDDAARPACCDVVPVLATGLDVSTVAEEALSWLRANGSKLVPGYNNPEGIVLFHEPSQHSYKVTLVGDESPKGLAA